MTMKLSCAMAVALALGAGANVAQAALHDRGAGLIYDDVLKITWLQNAAQGAGSAYDDGSNTTDGAMSWPSAMAWADNLIYAGYSDWRLPTMTDTGDPGCDFAYSGSDCGFNVDPSRSELAYMFAVNLGNRSPLDASGNPVSPSGLLNTGPFTHLKNFHYWTNVVFEPNPDRAWNFDMNNGYQNYDFEDRFFYEAWAVRNGDVAASAVPEPKTYALLLGGLGLLGFMRCRAQRESRF